MDKIYIIRSNVWAKYAYKDWTVSAVLLILVRPDRWAPLVSQTDNTFLRRVGIRPACLGKGIRCSSAAYSWATDRWACMCGAHVSGTPLQGTQLQRISFPAEHLTDLTAPTLLLSLLTFSLSSPVISPPSKPFES